MTTIIRNTRLLTMTDVPVIDHGWLVIEGDRITGVGPGDPGPLDPSIEVIDGAGQTVVPGLVDGHVHVVGLQQGPRQSGEHAHDVASDVVDLVDRLPRVAAGGITTVRDLGYPHHGIFAVATAVADGRLVGPRIIPAGRAICATGGHGASISVEISGADEARRAVRTEVKAGAAWLKLMVTGGTATPGEEVTDVQLTLDEVKAAVDEAHRRGRGVAAHCSNLDGLRLALDAGVDSIEHGIVIDEPMARRMADAGAWLCSTQLCTQVEGQAEASSAVPDFVRRKAEGIYRVQQASFQAALAAGVPIVAGTDTEVPYLPLDGATLARELQLLASLGMDPLDAIRAATARAAELIGVRDVGRLEPGAVADVLLVDGDPRADLLALGRPRRVWIGGRVVGRAAASPVVA